MARRRNTNPLMVATVVLGIALVIAGVSSVSGPVVSATRNGAEYSCLVDSRYMPDLGAGHHPESIIAEGSWSLIPLGLECTFVATDTGARDSVGPSPLPSALIVGGALIGCFAAIMARRAQQARAPEVPSQGPASNLADGRVVIPPHSPKPDPPVLSPPKARLPGKGAP